MSALYSIIKRYPVWAYFVLTFAWSWGAVLLYIGGPGNLLMTPERASAIQIPVAMALVSGPIIIGLLLTGLVSGRPGYREFFSRLLRWRVAIRWYAVALLTGPLVMTATLFVLSATSPVFIPVILTTGDKISALIGMIMVGLMGGIFEEPGWTGFATPRLRTRYGVFATGLIVGLLWGAWHYITAVFGSGTPAGEFSLDIFLPPMFFYVGVLPAYRMLMVWVYDRTESLLLGMLMHLSLTGCVFFIFMPEGIAGGALITWYLAMTVLLWMLVAAIAMANGWHLERQPLQRRMA